MRVLIGTVSYHPYVSGVSVFARSLARYLIANGDDVTVVGPAANGRTYPKKTTTEDGVHVIRVSSVANPFRPGFRMPLIWPSTATALVERVQPTIVHLQDPLPANWLLLRAAHRRGIPVVGTNHVQISLILSYVPRWLGKVGNWVIGRYLAWFYNQCDQITVPSHALEKAMRGYGVTRPIHVLSNGIDLARFQAIHQSAFENNGDRLPLVIAVGRVDKDKSVDVVIKAVGQLAATQPLQLVVVGGGEELNELQALVQKNHWGEAIRFTGSIPHDSQKLIAWYQQADCFVTASAIEAQGIVVLEAMAAGKPIVAADAAALPELVEAGKNGILVKPGNVVGFAAAIKTLLDNEKLRHQYGEASRRLAALHDSRKALPAFRALYESVLRAELQPEALVAKTTSDGGF